MFWFRRIKAKTVELLEIVLRKCRSEAPDGFGYARIIIMLSLKIVGVYDKLFTSFPIYFDLLSTPQNRSKHKFPL